MTSLDSLPLELLDLVLSGLPNRDIKSVRLACTHLGNAAQLHIHRVFLSPHPRDIQVFEAIAKHNTYRQHIVEIIYDDARFAKNADTQEYVDPPYDLYDPPPAGVPDWYAQIYNRYWKSLQRCNGLYEIRPDHVQIFKQLESRLGLQESYEHYQKVLKEQHQGMVADRDVKVLEYGLERFANLRRITLTPVAHGEPFRPFYETPMIRHLPYGFIYPIPRGWPESGGWAFAYLATNPWYSKEEANRCRGLRLLLRTLAKHPHSVTEFVVDVNQLVTGVNCLLFDEPNQEYDDLVSLLRRPHFSRIDLALDVGGQDVDDWHCYRNGLLKRALGEAKDLQHVSLSTTLGSGSYESAPHPFGAAPYFNPLRSIFPVDQWKQLRHFGLSRFVVQQDDLVALLSSLPSTLQSAQLNYLGFLRFGGGNYSGILQDMRGRLKWHQRPVEKRPNITIHIETEIPMPSWSVDVSLEAEDFVYRDGKNPFSEDVETRRTIISKGQGIGMERFAFTPADDRPLAHDETLVEMGIYRKKD